MKFPQTFVRAVRADWREICEFYSDNAVVVAGIGLCMSFSGLFAGAFIAAH